MSHGLESLTLLDQYWQRLEQNEADTYRTLEAWKTILEEQLRKWQENLPKRV